MGEVSGGLHLLLPTSWSPGRIGQLARVAGRDIHAHFERNQGSKLEIRASDSSVRRCGFPTSSRRGSRGAVCIRFRGGTNTRIWLPFWPSAIHPPTPSCMFFLHSPLLT